MKMKIISILVVMFVTCAIIIGGTKLTEHKSKTNLDIGNSNSLQHNKVKDYFKKDTVKEHISNSINCKTCHLAEYPTKTDPGLINCPRQGMISVFHKPEEGPEVVLLNEVAKRYEPVIFSHKLHSQMAEMGTSCNGCHHYNTTGPVLPCRKCHSADRKREDVSIPDLRAAYHRQCMQCHRQWNHTTGCNNTCHFPKDEKTRAKVDNELAKIIGKEHPPLQTPNKLTYETSYNKGKMVTFYHEEHVKLFKIQCVACHQENNCIKCHDKEHVFNNSDPEFTKPIKVKKSLDEHHKPCFGCHAGENKQADCNKCHKNNVMQPFNHAVTAGWTLNKFHVNLTCQQCHGDKTPYKKLDSYCISCHKNFVPSIFNHSKVGITLSASHIELNCDNCHYKNDFTKPPECVGCHDDKTYPQAKPGKPATAKKEKK